MPDTPPSNHTLLDALDARQNEVLHQLDELNDQVEHLLRQFAQPAPAPASPSRKQAAA